MNQAGDWIWICRFVNSCAMKVAGVPCPFHFLMLPNLRSLLMLALAASFTGVGAQEPAPLTTARDIAAHLTPKGEKASPVSLEATVTFQDPTGTIFLQDDTGATFITGAPDNPKIPRGERLRITGITHNGLFIGGIKNAHIERIGHPGSPAPREIAPDDLTSGEFHYYWITLTGVARSLHRDGKTRPRCALSPAARRWRCALTKRRAMPVRWWMRSCGCAVLLPATSMTIARSCSLMCALAAWKMWTC